MSSGIIELDSVTIRCQTLFLTFLKHAVDLLRSPQCSHCMSLAFVLMVFIMMIQTYDIRIGDVSEPSSKAKSEVNTKEEAFNSPPPKSSRHLSRAITQHIAPRSNALLADRTQVPGTPFSTVSTLTPDSNYKAIKFNENHDEDDEHSEDDHSCAPSEGTTMSGFSRIDYLLYENEVMKSSVYDPKVLIGWRIFVKGRGNGLVLSIKKVKFSSTKFAVQFENGTIEYLSLKRSATKGKIPFTLISNGSVSGQQ